MAADRATGKPPTAPGRGKTKRQAMPAVTNPERSILLRFLDRPLLRCAAQTALPLVCFVAMLRALLSRTIDLSSFGLGLLALGCFALFAWQGATFYLKTESRRRLRNLDPAPPFDPIRLFHHLPVWQDRSLCLLMAIAGIANMAIFAYVSARYGSLPPFLPLHYSATGDVDRLGTPMAVFMIPAIGIFVLLSNVIFSCLLYRKEPLASQLLLGSGIFVQLLLFFATQSIVSRA